jgi:hypothetical protein
MRYDGTQLRSLWAFRTCRLQGDSIVSFIGPCQVSRVHMVDQEDVLARSRIRSRRMLHFIVEHFDDDLVRTLLRQRLLVTIAREKINHRLNGDVVQRWGDDLYDGDAKLSISIATATPVSTIIHLGINITAQGAPVKAKGIEEYGLQARELAEAIMAQYVLEIEGVAQARCKVRAVP